MNSFESRLLSDVKSESIFSQTILVFHSKLIFFLFMNKVKNPNNNENA